MTGREIPVAPSILEVGSTIWEVCFSSSAQTLIVALRVFEPSPSLGFESAGIVLCNRNGDVLGAIATNDRLLRQLHVARQPMDDSAGRAVSTISAPDIVSHRLRRFRLEEPLNEEEAAPSIRLLETTNCRKTIVRAASWARNSLVIMQQVVPRLSYEWIWNRRTIPELADRDAVVSADGHQIACFCSFQASLQVFKSAVAFLRDEANEVLAAAEVLAH